MVTVDAPPLEELRQRRSAKWRSFPSDVLPLPVAEMDFPLAPPVAEVLLEAVRRSDTGYPGPPAEYAEALAGFAGRRWGWSLDPGQVRTVPDVGVGVVEVLRRAVDPGDRVVICPPVYPPFFAWVAEVGAELVEVPLARDPDGWRLDLGGLAAAFAAGARALLLCSPHNPVGRAHTSVELAQVAELASSYGVVVISDEIHAPLVLAGREHVPFLAVSEAARACGVAVLSASKAWNLAALKCAAVVTASAPMRELVARVPLEVSLRTGHFGVLAGVAALRHGEAWLAGALATIDRNRVLLAELLRDRLPEVGHLPPEAGYLAWLDFRALGWGDDPAARALERGRVALSPGPAFGAAGLGHARLNLATSAELLDEAVRRLARSR